MGLRRRSWTPLFAVPQGLIGRLGEWMMASMKGKAYCSMAAELDLQPDDELLDVGCGSAGFFAEHARHVHYVAGLDRPSNAALAALMPHAEARFALGLDHCWQRAAPDLHLGTVEAWVSGQELPTELRPEPAPSPEALERVRAESAATA